MAGPVEHGARRVEPEVVLVELRIEQVAAGDALFGKLLHVAHKILRVVRTGAHVVLAREKNDDVAGGRKLALRAPAHRTQLLAQCHVLHHQKPPRLEAE